ncbi:ABC transporter permease [Candidatus Saccharibacteria bacterium]|jgi:cell division transport system permease protein|nr:ABC transporter permease [Candidatus Saccharibacteria bacterium]
MNKYLITFGRIVKFGFLNFFRNAWLSTAATAIMLVTLVIMLTGLMLNQALSAETEAIVKDISVSIYFADNVKADQRKDLETELKAIDNVREVNYLTKNDALKIFAEKNKAQPELLDGISVGENALPASFEVKVYDLSKVKQVVDIAEGKDFKDFVEETSYDSDSQQRLDAIANVQKFLNRSSIGAGLIFAGISVLIIFNTIRMAIFTRGEEIKIMKLIGASNSFIRGPFLFEASMYGLVAGTISLTLIYAFLGAWSNEINKYLLSFDSTLNFFNDNALYIVLGTLGVGISIGVISSLLAMARYLKLR